MCIELRKSPALCLGLSVLLTAGCATQRFAILGPGDPAIWYPHHLQQSSARRFEGPFRCGALAFYLVHHGGNLLVEIHFQQATPKPEDTAGAGRRPAIFWQLYDAEEKLYGQEFFRFAHDREPQRDFAVRIADAPPGIYQLRYATSGSGSAAVDIATTPPVSFGVMPCRARLHEGVKGQFAETYLYIPPTHDSITLHTYATTVEVQDENGQTLDRTEKGSTAISVLPESVLRVSATFGWEQAAFGISGVPPILCPDEVTARNIRGSVEVAPDGTLLSHKFQLRMWDWMHNRRSRDFAVKPVDLTRRRDEWMRDPRNAGLVGTDTPFTHIPRILRDQKLDPNDLEYGLGTSTSWLGPAYVIDEPFNPYHRNEAILNRIVLEEFARFLRLEENGTFKENNWDNYGGGDALGYRKRAFQFGYVAPHVSPDLRDLWFEGAAKVPNRWGMDRVSCENQSSHWMLDLYLLYLAGGREEYQRMARDFALGISDPALNSYMRTGYQQEAYGPDATYNGLTACQMAIYYKFSRDEVIRDCLRTTYEFFNHTVVPEPDGQMHGASNFSHRTAGSWVHRQYNGGLHLMSDELGEAGVWYPNKANIEAYRQGLIEHIAEQLGRRPSDEWYEKNMRWATTYGYSPWVSFFHTYMFPFRGLEPGTWPALRSDRFERNFNEEFIFIRRPGYYAGLYLGKTSPSWTRNRLKQVPVVGQWEHRDGTLVPVDGTAKKAIWSPTQGLSVFWTPEYGNFTVTKNWCVYTANIVRADLPGGAVAWSDYYSLREVSTPPDGNARELARALFDLPVTTTRRYSWEESGLRIDLAVVCEEDVAAERLVEQIPYLWKDGLSIRYGDGKDWRDSPSETCSAVRFEHGTAAIEVRFDAPARVRHGVFVERLNQRLGLLEVDLPNDFKKGTESRLSYTIRPVRADTVP